MMSFLTPLRRLYYGWWMVLGSSVFQMYHAGTWWYGFSVLMRPLTEEFGWSRALTAAAMSFSSVEGGFLAPLIGWGIDRFGPRRVLVLGMLLFAGGHLLLSRIASLWGFYTVYVLVISLGAQMCVLHTHNASVARWFQRWRGRAMGLISVGSALGGVMVTPALAGAIAAYGWRGAVVGVAVGSLVVGIPVALVFRSRLPEHYGLVPDGMAPGARPTAATSPAGHQLPATGDFTVRQALGSRTFWMLALAWVFSGSAFSAISLHLVALLQDDRGLPVSWAAFGLSLFTFALIPSRLLGPWLAEYVTERRVYAACLGLQALGLTLLAGAPTVAWVYGAIALFGFGAGATLPLRPAIIAAYFGRKSFASIQGWMTALSLVGQTTGPLLAGWVFDVTDSYNAALLGLALVCLASFPLVLGTKGSLRLVSVGPSLPPSERVGE